jgi:hypothetical protein
MPKERKPATPRRRYVRFTRWRRRRFFALLAESGNVRMAAELAGVGLGAIYRLRKVEAGFTERMAEAVAVASGRLGRGPASFPHPPIADAIGPSIAATLGTFRGTILSPQSPDGRGEFDSGLVIRRGIGGRLRVMAVSPRSWQDRHDPVFLGHLAATGNVGAAARAAGFTKKSAYDRRKARPDFAAAWDKALERSAMHLQGRLLAEAHRGLAPAIGGDAFEAAFEAADAAPFDPWLAIRLCRIWERKRAGRSRE